MQNIRFYVYRLFFSLFFDKKRRKKYILPYRFISQQDQKIRDLQKSLDSQAKNAYVDKNLELLLAELNSKKSAVDIPTKKTKFKLSNRKNFNQI